MAWFVLTLPLVYIALGFILTEKNAPTLMSGYHSLTDEEKAVFPLKKSVRFFRRFHWIMGFITLIIGISLYAVGEIDLAVNAVVLLPLLAYQYFIYRSIGFAPQRQKKMLWALFVFMLFVIAGLTALNRYGNQPNRLEITDNSLTISGMYGVSLSKNDISRLGLTDSLPAIRFKSNGFATGEVRKGYFRTRDGRTIRLFLSDRDAPMLYIKLSEGKDIYYQSTNESAEVVYEKVNNWLNP